jgi:hypothetical protein
VSGGLKIRFSRKHSTTTQSDIGLHLQSDIGLHLALDKRYRLCYPLHMSTKPRKSYYPSTQEHVVVSADGIVLFRSHEKYEADRFYMQEMRRIKTAEKKAANEANNHTLGQ